LHFGLLPAPQWFGQLVQRTLTMQMESMSLVPPVAMEIIATQTVIELK
jgi:hypothetical protein